MSSKFKDIFSYENLCTLEGFGGVIAGISANVLRPGSTEQSAAFFVSLILFASLITQNMHAVKNE